MRVRATLPVTCIFWIATMPVFAEDGFLRKPLHWPLPMTDPAAQDCRRLADQFVGSLNDRMRQSYDTGVCEYMRSPITVATMNLSVYMQYVCQQEAVLEREAQAQARERAMIAGSGAGVAGSYSAQRTPGSGGPSQSPPSTPDTGGAGGSQPMTFEGRPAYEWKQSPETIPGGGAGGALAATDGAQRQRSPTRDGARTHVATAPATASAPANACDPKSFGDAQLRLLLADPVLRSRLTRLIAGGANPQQPKSGPKAKTERKIRREGAAGASASVDRPVPRGPDPGPPPGAADALGTMIGVGVGIGLGNVGRRGQSDPIPRRGTYDAPPR